MLIHALKCRNVITEHPVYEIQRDICLRSSDCATKHYITLCQTQRSLCLCLAQWHCGIVYMSSHASYFWITDNFLTWSCNVVRVTSDYFEGAIIIFPLLPFNLQLFNFSKNNVFTMKLKTKLTIQLIEPTVCHTGTIDW